MKNKSKSEIINYLKELKRYEGQICGGCECCGTWIEYEETETGDYINQNDIQKLIDFLENDNIKTFKTI